MVTGVAAPPSADTRWIVIGRRPFCKQDNPVGTPGASHNSWNAPSQRLSRHRLRRQSFSSCHRHETPESDRQPTRRAERLHLFPEAAGRRGNREHESTVVTCRRNLWQRTPACSRRERSVEEVWSRSRKLPVSGGADSKANRGRFCRSAAEVGNRRNQGRDDDGNCSDRPGEPLAAAESDNRNRRCPLRGCLERSALLRSQSARHRCRAGAALRPSAGSDAGTCRQRRWRPAGSSVQSGSRRAPPRACRTRPRPRTPACP